MSSGIKNSLEARKQLRDDPEITGNRPASSIIHTATTTSFSTIGTSGQVTNIAGHVIHGNVNMHMYNGTSILSSSLNVPPPSQPSAPDIWFGRDGIVSTLVTIITGNENPRIAILGAGGMGKTATALHLMQHEAVVARYRTRAFFVACDAATSAEWLASRILQVIGVSAGTGENLVTVMHNALKCAPPTLFVLDNFESLWDADKNHTATRDLLQKIADSPSSTLIITMRATTPPPGIRWTFFKSLPPLAASSAREVFLAINASFCDGWDDGKEVLEELLRELDHVPLAIHLLAHVSTDMSPKFVLKQWQKQRTQILSLDRYTTDKLESVNVSISFSMNSLDVERNPEAIQLLGMLCLLPDGLLHWQERLDIIEETFETATSDLLLLRNLALVYTVGGKLGVLSPIRYFVLKHHPPDARHAQCIYHIIWELVRTYAPVDFGPGLHGAIMALSPEMGNIGNLIDHAVAHDPGEIIVDIVIQISWHLWRTHPSSHLLKRVSGLVPSVTTQMQARYFQVSGNIRYLQSEYIEAASAFTQARDFFLETKDRLGAARCLRRLGDVLSMQSNYSKAIAILMDARAQFIEIGEHLGAAQCLKSLGGILFRQANYSEAKAILTDARAQFIKIVDRLGAAQCSLSLGNILIMQSNYSEATAIFTSAQAEFFQIGDWLGYAQCSESLGDIFRVQGNYSEATAILTSARAQFIDIGDRMGAAQCSQSLGHILRSQRNYYDATVILMDARSQFIEIGDRLGTARCSQILGNILSDQGNDSEATAILTDARAQFIEIGNRVSNAECSASLGDILLRQRNYTEAENLLAHARDQFIDIGRHEWTAYCTALLEQCVRTKDKG